MGIEYDKRPYLFPSHEFWGFRRIGWVQKLRHDEGELLELDRFRNVRVEASFHALLVNIAEDVCRERDDRMTTVSILLFPSPNFLAGLVAILVRHMEVALSKYQQRSITEPCYLQE